LRKSAISKKNKKTTELFFIN
jgi:hypothetical protein